MAVNGSHPSSTTSPYATTLPNAANHPSRTFTIASFRITTQKLPILKAGPIDTMTNDLGITPPEMIFGDNYISITHLPTQWSISFSAFGALSRVDKTGSGGLKVSYSKEWHQSREDQHEIKGVVKPFDWSYSTDYKGDVSQSSTSQALQFTPSTLEIPLELLKRPDPILFFDDVMLYEDELADNGLSVLSVKIRVMPKRLLLLSRFFMRLDNVVVRIRDTRVYVDIDQEVVTREYLARERSYEDIRETLAGRGEEVAAVFRDPTKLVDVVPVVEQVLEEVQLNRREGQQNG